MTFVLPTETIAQHRGTAGFQFGLGRLWVKWVLDGDARNRAESEAELLRQVWFAGDHSDLGGSYTENESRLSDNAFEWMIAQLKELPHPVLLDESVLRLYTLPLQHDEARNGLSRIWGMLFQWPKGCGTSTTMRRCTASVLQRFAAAEVLIYDRMRPYGPEQLRHQVQVRQHYQ